MRVVGTGGTAQAAIALVEQFQPDVLILDARLPGDAVTTIARIAALGVRTQVLVFSALEDPDVAISAIEAGALGYVLKGSTIEELFQAVRMVHAGESYITPGFAARIVAGLRAGAKAPETAQKFQLTVREDQVLALLKKGYTNREIGSALRISEKTVKHYVTVLMQKLNARNRTEVVLAAMMIEKERASLPHHRSS